MMAALALLMAASLAWAQFQRSSVEPFNPQRLLPIAPMDLATSAQKKAAQATLLNRLTAPLEASPLAGIRMVGSLQKDGQPVALLRVNGLIYPVRVGDRLGQDQGRISAITLSALVLSEIVPGPAGQSIERVVSLALVSEP
jgi:type IV pilus assembly protein PilP